VLRCSGWEIVAGKFDGNEDGSGDNVGEIAGRGGATEIQSGLGNESREEVRAGRRWGSSKLCCDGLGAAGVHTPSPGLDLDQGWANYGPRATLFNAARRAFTLTTVL